MSYGASPGPRGRERPRPTLRRLLRSAALRAVLGGGLAAAVLAVASPWPAPEHPPRALEATVDRDAGGRPAADPPPAVWTAHDDVCWDRGEDPLTAIPGAAVVRWVDGWPAYVTRPAVVSSAFAEVLAEIGPGRYDDPRFDVIGLCS